MGRSGYSEDLDNWDLIKWRGQVASAIRGRRGQRFLVDLIEALDALPKQELITEELVTEEGEVCALGAVAKARGIDVGSLDPYDFEVVAKLLNIATPMAQEVFYLNDEYGFRVETPHQRWQRIRNWALEHYRTEAMP